MKNQLRLFTGQTKTFFFIILIFVLLFTYACDDKESKIKDKHNGDGKQENGLYILEGVIDNKFEIFKDGETVGEYSNTIDKSDTIWRINEETRFGDEVYKKSEFSFHSKAYVILDMNINTYTTLTEDIVEIDRDNQNNEYKVKYRQKNAKNEEQEINEADSVFVDNKNTFIINNNLFGAYELAFQTLQPIEKTKTISSIVPVLQNILETKIRRISEDKINLNNNIIETIVFEVIRPGTDGNPSKQEVWVSKDNYKIIRIKVIEGITEIEVRRVIKTEDDVKVIKEKNNIAGKQNFKLLKSIKSDEEYNTSSEKESDSTDVEGVEEIEISDTDVNFNEIKKSYEFSTSSGSIFGYNEYTFINSENFMQISETSKVKLAKGPGVVDKSYNLSYMWNKSKNQIMSFDGNIESDEEQILLALTEKSGEKRIIIDSDEERKEVGVSYEEIENFYFVIPYTISHFEVLFRNIDFNQKFPSTFKIFNYKTKQKDKLEIKSVELLKGGEVDTDFSQLKVSLNIAGINYFVYLNNEDKSIYKADIPSEGIVIREINPEKVDFSALKTKSVMEKLYIEMKGESIGQVSLSDYKYYTELGAEIYIKSASPYENKNINFYLDNRLQSFNGITNDNKITGTVEISSISNSKFPSDKYPIEEFPENQKEFIESRNDDVVNIPVENKQIKDFTQTLIKDKDNIFEVAKTIGEWIYNNISYKLTGNTALETFITKEGDSGSKVQLTITMLRSVGIPARVVGGVLYGDIYDSNFGQHYWVEVWVGNKSGWLMIDPTTGEFDQFSPLHISLWRWENIAPDDETFIDIAYVEKEDITAAEGKIPIKNNEE